MRIFSVPNSPIISLDLSASPGIVANSGYSISPKRVKSKLPHRLPELSTFLGVSRYTHQCSFKERGNLTV